MYENVAVIANRYLDLFGQYRLLYVVSGCYSPAELKVEIEPIVKTGAPILVFDVSAVNDDYADQLAELCRYMRMVLPQTRIIVFAPDLPASSLARDLVNIGIYDFICDIPYDIKARRDKRLTDEIYWAVMNPREFFEVSKYLDAPADTPKKTAPAEKAEKKVFGLFGRRKPEEPLQESVVRFAPVLDQPKRGTIINLAAFDHADAIDGAKRIATALAEADRSVLVMLFTDVIRPADVYKLPADTVAGWAAYTAKAEPFETADSSAHWREFPGLCSMAPSTNYFAVAPALGQSLEQVVGSYDPEVLKPKLGATLTACRENFDVALLVTVMGSWLYDFANMNSAGTFVLLTPSDLFSPFFSSRDAYRTSYLIDGGNAKDVKKLAGMLTNDRYSGRIAELPTVIKAGKSAGVASIVL